MLIQFTFVLSAIGALASTSAGQVAHFETFEEGTTDTALFDPVSGISFFDSTASSQNFTIETIAASPQRPMTSPGNILSANGYVPGGSFGLTYGFGFTAVLPAVTDSLSFDVIYALQGGIGTFDLILYSENGQVLDTLNQSFSGSDFSEGRVTIQNRLQRDIYSFSVANLNGLYIAYDNFAVPEPSILFAATAGLAGRRRRAV